ncbi:MAG: pantoate--beta-alanine ligase [Acidobacteriota bacterium]
MAESTSESTAESMPESIALPQAPALEVVVEPADLRARIATWRRAGLRIGFVPTMGALHAGHLSLIARARARTDRVVASVFVNPTQFGAGEDFDSYPRDLAGDRGKLRAAGCDLVFAPERSTMYPPGETMRIDPAGVAGVPSPADGFEATERPGHFAGVATVVAKLFHLVAPDVAVFGEKDAQQLAVIRRLVRDLHLPVDIVAAPIVREEDGLAMSSRNVYLDPAQRRAAAVLSRALRAAASQIDQGTREAEAILGALRATLATEPSGRVDYVALVDASSFQPVERIEGDCVLPIAVRFGATRLLDNLHIHFDPHAPHAAVLTR